MHGLSDIAEAFGKLRDLIFKIHSVKWLNMRHLTDFFINMSNVKGGISKFILLFFKKYVIINVKLYLAVSMFI